MTTNQTIDDVPRDLIEKAMLACFEAGHGITHDELRALLDADQRPEGCCCPPKGFSGLWAGARCPVHFGLRAIKPAAQPQGEPVAILSGPDDSVCWTQDSTPKELRKQVVLIEHADLLRLQGLASGADQTVYQTRWCSLGEWEEWKTVNREQYERSDGQLFERRIVYAEQPAPVAVVQKYDDTLLPFVSLMRKELHANAGKGDRPGWLSMSADTCMLEIIYHFGKLQKAVRKGGGDSMSEYAADVANLCMMLLDICGALAFVDLAAPVDKP